MLWINNDDIFIKCDLLGSFLFNILIVSANMTQILDHEMFSTSIVLNIECYKKLINNAYS